LESLINVCLHIVSMELTLSFFVIFEHAAHLTLEPFFLAVQSLDNPVKVLFLFVIFWLDLFLETLSNSP